MIFAECLVRSEAKNRSWRHGRERGRLTPDQDADLADLA